MNKYKIYCTEEQTRKAFELGAPIEIFSMYEEFINMPKIKCADGSIRPFIIPTAEEMIGWLEDQEGIISVDINKWDNEWGYNVDTTSRDEYLCKIHCSSRKEASLAAIDDALEYLISL